jgi:hypothetical protein
LHLADYAKRIKLGLAGFAGLIQCGKVVISRAKNNPFRQFMLWGFLQ